MMPSPTEGNGAERVSSVPSTLADANAAVRERLAD